jgi:hypothetical protein
MNRMTDRKFHRTIIQVEVLSESPIGPVALDTYMQKHTKAAPKTRNERRGVVKMFLQWCVEKDYLAPTHRLFEAGGLKHEPANLGEIECYTAEELLALLERASKQPGPAKDGREGLRHAA